MRLIDADALAGMLDVEYERKMKLVQNGETHLNTLAEGIMSMSVVLGTMPTVEAVVLPCKLGTTLYRICEEGCGRKPFIREVTFNRTNFARIVLDNEVGRTVFLTREEAEAALVKMKGLEVGA